MSTRSHWQLFLVPFIFPIVGSSFAKMLIDIRKEATKHTFLNLVTTDRHLQRLYKSGLKFQRRVFRRRDHRIWVLWKRSTVGIRKDRPTSRINKRDEDGARRAGRNYWTGKWQAGYNASRSDGVELKAAVGSYFSSATPGLRWLNVERRMGRDGRSRFYGKCTAHRFPADKRERRRGKRNLATGSTGAGPMSTPVLLVIHLVAIFVQAGASMARHVPT